MSTEIIVKEEEIFDLSRLEEPQRIKAQEIAQTINVNDSQAVVQYGVGAQSNISKFADTILQEFRAKDTGYVGEMLTSLVLNVKDLDVDDLGDEEHFWEKLPLIGGLVDRAKRFVAKYEKMSVQLETIIENLEKARMNLLKDLSMLDNLHAKNVEYLKELDIYIAAGVMKLKELKEKDLPQMEEAAKASNDPVDAQRFQDLSQMIVRFEKKLHDLKLSRMVSIQIQPQIRLIQNNNQLLVEKIQSSILNTIPLWKNQIIIAISLLRQKKALEAQREVTDSTNEMLQKNSEMLKQNSIETAKEGERGIVELETLKKVNSDLITTIEETLKIQSEGRAKRQTVEAELARMEEELKQKLLSASRPE